MFSMQFKHNNFQTSIFIQYLVSLSIVDCIREKSEYKVCFNKIIK